MKDIWVSSDCGTGMITIDDSDIILKTPPLWKKFKGQNAKNLAKWLNKVSGITVWTVLKCYENKKELDKNG